MGWRVGGESQEWKSGSLGEATALGERTAAPLSWPHCKRRMPRVHPSFTYAVSWRIPARVTLAGSPGRSCAGMFDMTCRFHQDRATERQVQWVRKRGLPGLLQTAEFQNMPPQCLIGYPEHRDVPGEQIGGTRACAYHHGNQTGTVGQE